MKSYSGLVGKMERVHLLRRMFSQQLTNNTTLHFGQVPVLLYIWKHDRCTQVDLAEALHVTPASIATSTKRLHKAPFDAFEEAAFSGFSEQELNTLANYLDRIAQNMAQHIGEELPPDNFFAMQAFLNRVMEQAK